MKHSKLTSLLANLFKHLLSIITYTFIDIKTGKKILKKMKEFIDVSGNKWLISGEYIPEGLFPIKPKQNMIEKLPNHKKPSKMKGKQRKYPQRLISARGSGYMLKPKINRRKNGKRK